MRTDLEHDFERKTSIWHACVIKEGQTTTASHQWGDDHEGDITVDSEWYNDWYFHGLLPPGRQDNMPWAETLNLTVQQDEATSRTGKDTPQKLNRAGREQGEIINLVIQPAQPRYLSINGSESLSSLKSRVRQDMDADVQTHFIEFPAETPERVW